MPVSEENRIRAALEGVSAMEVYAFLRLLEIASVNQNPPSFPKQ